MNDSQFEAFKELRLTGEILGIGVRRTRKASNQKWLIFAFETMLKNALLKELSSHQVYGYNGDISALYAKWSKAKRGLKGFGFLEKGKVKMVYGKDDLI